VAKNVKSDKKHFWRTFIVSYVFSSLANFLIFQFGQFFNFGAPPPFFLDPDCQFLGSKWPEHGKRRYIWGQKPIFPSVSKGNPSVSKGNPSVSKGKTGVRNELNTGNVVISGFYVCSEIPRIVKKGSDCNRIGSYFLYPIYISITKWRKMSKVTKNTFDGPLLYRMYFPVWPIF